MEFFFEGENKALAVSQTDGIRIQALLGGEVEGRSIVIEPHDATYVCVHVMQ